MSIEARLYSHLTNYAGLAALTGARWSPIQLPQAAVLPAGTYLRVSTVPLLTRPDPTPTYSWARFQLDGWAVDYDAMIALRRQIRLAMGAFAREAPPRVDLAVLAGDRDLFEPDAARWRCSLDYTIYFVED